MHSYLLFAASSVVCVFASISNGEGVASGTASALRGADRGRVELGAIREQDVVVDRSLEGGAARGGQSSITVEYPNGGEVLDASQYKEVRWTSTGVTGQVAVWLCKSGERYQHLGGVPADEGHFWWGDCAYGEDDNDYSIVIVGWDGVHQVEDGSDSPFSLVGFEQSLPEISVSYPEGGDVWEAGETQEIRWNSTTLDGNVSIFLNCGYEFERIARRVPVADGAYEWDICEFGPSGEECWVSLSWSSSDCYYGSVGADSGKFALRGREPLPTLTVESPLAGDVLEAGSTYPIAWNCSTDEGYVSFRLYRDGEFESLMDSVAAADGSYDWWVCDYGVDSANYTIQLGWSADCGDDVEVSSEPFEIVGLSPLPTLEVISPAEGDYWEAGTTQKVLWDCAATNGYISASIFKGDEYIQSITSYVPAGVGATDFYVCENGENGDDYSIQLSWHDRCYSWVNADGGEFEIGGLNPMPTLRITNPVDGDVLLAGTTEVIEWESTSSNGYLHIMAFDELGRWSEYVGWTRLTAGSMDWDICAYGDQDKQLRLWPSWGTYSCVLSDMSLDNIPISVIGHEPYPVVNMTSDLGGEVLVAGTTQLLSWESETPEGRIEAVLYKGNEYLERLGTVDAGEGVMEWQVCQYTEAGDDYRVVLSWFSDECSTREEVATTGEFSIVGGQEVPVFSILSPAGGDVLQAGSTQTIVWESFELTGEVRVSVRGEMYDESIGTFPVSDLSAEWQVCNYGVDSGNYSIGLYWYGDCGSSVEVNSETFTIVGLEPWPSVRVTSPAGGEQWALGETHLISWDGELAVDSVDIEIRKGGMSFDFELDVPAEDGEFEWTICNHVGEGDDYTIGVRMSECGGGYSVLSSPFSISVEDEADCNGNYVADLCEIATGRGADCDSNGILDECEIPCDLDNDGDADVDDRDLFIEAFGRSAGDAKYSSCADYDGDGLVSFVDYQMWMECYRSERENDG